MPDHVHAVIWFSETGTLSSFVRVWKQRSSFQIKRIMKEHLKSYFSKIPVSDPIWQPGYHDFNIYSEEKLREKVDYMHNNPVRAGLVESPEHWKYSSARFHLDGKSVAVPIEFPC
jgi:putative transposase